MAYSFSSQMPGATRKSSYTTSNTQKSTKDNFDDMELDDNDINENYPIILDVPFYHKPQHRSSDSNSKHKKTSDGYYTPQLKKRCVLQTTDSSTIDALTAQLESIHTMMLDFNRKLDTMTKKETEVEKRLNIVDRRIFGLVRQTSTPNELPNDLPVVEYEGRNLLISPIAPTPGCLMKRLINQLFTKEEIMQGQHEQTNEKTVKIKGAIQAYVFPQDENKFLSFWHFEGKIIRGNQRRGLSHRKKQTMNIESNRKVDGNTTLSNRRDSDDEMN